MKVISLTACNNPEMACSLEKFETEFTYPLGAHQRFGIRHGTDYLRFFRAMGEAQCYVAMENGCIIGTIAMALRRLIRPDGCSQSAAYLGDLKIAPSVRGSRALVNLARMAASWAQERARVAFSVVMDGTDVTPDRYTGRAGLPAFGELAKIAVIRLPTTPSAPVTQPPDVAEFETTMELFQSLSGGRYAAPAFAPQMRSEIVPQAIALPDGEACGYIEDTRLGKRLIMDGGAELVSAHLSHFAYRSASDGARLVHAARGQAARLGFPALFFAVHQPDAHLLLDALATNGATLASATVYGYGLPCNAGWNINTSEI